MMSQVLFPVEDTANILHVSIWTIYRLVSSGKLKSVRYNARSQFFEKEEIERYARENDFWITIPDRSQKVNA